MRPTERSRIKRNSMLLSENIHASKYMEAITRTIVDTKKLVRSSNCIPVFELEFDGQLDVPEILALNRELHGIVFAENSTVVG